MAFIRRKWTPKEADNWTREDWVTIIISPLAYILLMIGVGLSLFLLTSGFIVLALGVILTILMHWVIDPKLKAVSEKYEKSQKGYLESLEKQVRWEDKS